MRYRLPSLNALRALEAAGRRGSLTAASQELGVSVGAISRHIQLLEAHFGRTLLRRQPSGVEPTPECAAYLRSLAEAFGEIDAASHRLASDRRLSRALRLRFYSSFTTEWLAPRLPEFRALHPDILLDFTLSTLDAQWRDDDFDMALTGMPPENSEFRRGKLFDVRIALVCAPGLLADGAPWPGAAGLSGQTLLVAPREAALWRALLSAIGAPPLEEHTHMWFDSLSLTVQAARGGGGIALGNLFMIADDLRERRLVLPLARTFHVEAPHYLVTRRARCDNHSLTAFRAWIMDKAQTCADHLATMLAPYPLDHLPPSPDRQTGFEKIVSSSPARGP